MGNEYTQEIARMVAEERADRLHREAPRRRAQSLATRLGLSSAALGGGLLYGGTAVERALQNRDILTAQNREALERFTKAMSSSPNASSFVRDYTTLGHRAMSMPLADGATTGAEQMRRMYQNPLFGRLAGLGGSSSTTWDAGKAQHYDAFARGPLRAYEQLVRELPGRGNMVSTQDALKTIQGQYLDRLANAQGGAAWKAFQEVSEADKHGNLLENKNFRKAFSKHLRAETGRSNLRLMRNLRKLKETDPGLYGQLNQLLYDHGRGTQISSNPHDILRKVVPGADARDMSELIKSNSRAARFLRSSGVQAGRAGNMPIEAQDRLLGILSRSRGDMLEEMNRQMYKGWAGARGSYSSLAGGLSKYQKAIDAARRIARRAGRLGRGGLMVGGTMAGAGLLGRLFNRRPRVVEKQGAAFDAPPLSAYSGDPELTGLLRRLGPPTRSQAATSAAQPRALIKAPLRQGALVSGTASSAAPSRLKLLETLRAAYQGAARRAGPMTSGAKAFVRRHPYGSLAAGAGALISGAALFTPNPRDVELPAPRPSGLDLPRQAAYSSAWPAERPGYPITSYGEMKEDVSRLVAVLRQRLGTGAQRVASGTRGLLARLQQ